MKKKVFLEEYLPPIVLTLIALLLYLILVLTKATFSNNNQAFFFIAIIWIPALFYTLFKLRVPSVFKWIFYPFIICSNLLATTLNVYSYIPFFDTILHGAFGYVGCYFAIYLFAMKHDKVSALTIALLGFFMSLGCGVLWEFCEYVSDVFFAANTQHAIESGIIDTMQDFSANTLGAALFLVHCTVDHFFFQNRYFNMVYLNFEECAFKKKADTIKIKRDESDSHQK